jgi:hypothetical protein
MRAVKVNNIIRNHEASLSLSRLISHRMCFLVISSHFYHLFSYRKTTFEVLQN